MSSIPSMKKQLVPFRGPSSSESFNQMQDDVFYDITQLYDTANNLENELGTVNRAMFTENRFQQLRIQELENQLAQMESDLLTLKDKSGKFTSYAFAEDMISETNATSNEQASIDTFHGLVHLPITGKLTSKVYIYDEVANEIVTPSSLVVDVLPKVELGWEIQENNPLNACNGDNYSYWHRKVIVPLELTPTRPIRCEFIVTLPESIISSRDVNTLYVHPFPLNAVTIEKIEYQLDGEWKLLDGWPLDESGIPIPYENAGNLKFCIPTVAMGKVRISMMQPRYVEENYKKVYHFGLQEFGIFHADYQSERGKFNMMFHLEGSTTDKLLTGITPKFFNEGALSDKSKDKSSIFSFNVFTVDDQGQIQYTKDTFPILVTSKDIYVSASIYTDEYTKATPALEYVELNYQNV